MNADLLVVQSNLDIKTSSSKDSKKSEVPDSDKNKKPQNIPSAET